MKKILKQLLIILIIILTITSICFANNIDAGNFKPSTVTNDPELTKIGNSIIGMARVIGSIASVGILSLIAINIILASPEKKAELKGRLVPYTVGAVMLFAIVNLLAIAYNIFN